MKIGRLFLETVYGSFLIMTFSLADSEVVCEKLGKTGEAFPHLSLPVIILSAWQHTCRGGMWAIQGKKKMHCSYHSHDLKKGKMISCD